jgi:dihydroorotase
MKIMEEARVMKDLDINKPKQYQRIVIQGARLIDPASETDAQLDLVIEDGVIQSIQPGGTQQAVKVNETTQVLDAKGYWVIPGLVDLSVRLREPGFEYKATLESELKAAVAGGITHLVCPPDTDPVLDEPALVEMLTHRAHALRGSYVFPLGALTNGLKGEEIAEFAELSEAGCVGFSQADEPLFDTQVLLRALQYAHTFGFSVWLRPQDPYLAKGGVAHSGPIAGRLGLPGLPVSAETVALNTLFELMRQIRDEANQTTQVHLCRLSSAAGVDLVRKAKAEGLPVSCDVSAHHLHLTEHDIGFFDPHARLMPPLRSERDRRALVVGLLDGTIDAVCSDHTPVDDDEKKRPFGEASVGATGLELLLSLVVKLADQEGVPLVKALRWVGINPARVIGQQRVGADVGGITIGSSANLVIVNPGLWRVSADRLCSQGKHTPFLGYELPAFVQSTLINGRLVFNRTPTVTP